jgi:ABC transporter transmembrane region 2/Putative glucoamylase
MADQAQAAEEPIRSLTDEDMKRLQWTTILYYLHETNPDNGLVRDKTDPAAPCSIAALGMSLATLPVAVERGVFFRPFAAKLARRKLRYLRDLPQGPQPDASGYKGFFCHFLDIETGRRVWQCELSTIDSACLFAGMLIAAAYFDHATADEAEVRRIAEALYRRADWDWARDRGPTLTHGWRPESGFLPYRWEGYDEGLLLYVLGLGSPTYPLPPESYTAFCATYQWKELYGRELLYSGPLFTHQLSHLWIDFRGLRDAFMRKHGSDYFCVFAASTAVAVFQSFAEQRLGLLSRAWLTDRLIRRYLAGRTYYWLKETRAVDNPDQRIAEDVKAFTATTLSFTLIFLNGTFTVVAFAGVLWTISRMLFGVAVAYAAMGSLLSILLGRSLVGLNYRQLDREANFRSALNHVDEHAESVALLHWEGQLTSRLLRRLDELVDNYRRITSVNRNLGVFTTGYNYLIQIIPALIVAPLFIRGDVEFGVITQAAMAFAQLLGAFSLIINQFQYPPGPSHTIRSAVRCGAGN